METLLSKGIVTAMLFKPPMVMYMVFINVCSQDELIFPPRISLANCIPIS